LLNIDRGKSWSTDHFTFCISDTYNDWTEVGTSERRTCWKHIEHHGYPTWGTTIGDCVPWYSAGVPCPVKKYVFCCESSDPGGSATSSFKQSVLMVLA